MRLRSMPADDPTHRFRCPRCHDVAPVAMRCDRCALDMIPDVGGVAMSVHGETRSGFRPTGVRAIGSLMIVNAILAALLARGGYELWGLPAIFAAICAFTFAFWIPVVLAINALRLVKLKRWPANASARAINDAKDGEVACVRGRVVMASGEPIDVDGVRCVATSTSARAGVTTRAVPFVVEDRDGRRVVVDVTELIVCAAGAHAVVPVGAAVEVAGVARWREHGEENATFRSGPGLMLASDGDEPVRVRLRDERSESVTRVRVAAGTASAAGGEVLEDDRVAEEKRESIEARR